MKCPRCGNDMPEGLRYRGHCSRRVKRVGPFSGKYLPICIGTLALVLLAAAVVIFSRQTAAVPTPAAALLPTGMAKCSPMS